MKSAASKQVLKWECPWNEVEGYPGSRIGHWLALLIELFRHRFKPFSACEGRSAQTIHETALPRAESQISNLKLLRSALQAAFVAAALTNWTNRAQPYGQPDRDQPGDTMIQEFLRRETEQIHAAIAQDLRSTEDWNKLRSQHKQEYAATRRDRRNSSRDLPGKPLVVAFARLHAGRCRMLERRSRHRLSPDAGRRRSRTHCGHRNQRRRRDDLLDRGSGRARQSRRPGQRHGGYALLRAQRRLLPFTRPRARLQSSPRVDNHFPSRHLSRHAPLFARSARTLVQPYRFRRHHCCGRSSP